jgi:hypothetical protein
LVGEEVAAQGAGVRVLAAAKAQAEERNPNQIDGDEGEIYCVEACRKYSLRHESEFIVGKTFFEMCLGTMGGQVDFAL